MANGDYGTQFLFGVPLGYLEGANPAIRFPLFIDYSSASNLKARTLDGGTLYIAPSTGAPTRDALVTISLANAAGRQWRVLTLGGVKLTQARLDSGAWALIIVDAADAVAANYRTTTVDGGNITTVFTGTGDYRALLTDSSADVSATPLVRNIFGGRVAFNPVTGGSALLGGGGVSDLALPATNQLAWWYGGNGAAKPPEISASGDGGAVTTWTDKTVNAYAPTQTTPSARPTFRQSVTAANNRGGVEFASASSQHLIATVGAGIVTPLSVYSLYIVFVTTQTTLVGLYAEGNTGSGNPLLHARLNPTAGGISAVHRDGAGTAASPASAGGLGANDGNAHIYALIRTASNAFSLLLDGVEVATSTSAPGATLIDRIVLGALGVGPPSNHFNGTMCTISAYGGIDNRDIILPLLGTHYDISVPL